MNALNCQQFKKTTLMGQNGSADFWEPIPGVYIPTDVADVVTEMRRLFPRTHFAHLWETYPRAFGLDSPAG